MKNNRWGGGGRQKRSAVTLYIRGVYACLQPPEDSLRYTFEGIREGQYITATTVHTTQPPLGEIILRLPGEGRKS